MIVTGMDVTEGHDREMVGLLLLYYFPSLFILLITHFGLMLHALLFVIVYTYMY